MYGHAGTPSVYNASTYKYENGYTTNKDDIYSGSKSLYAKSPPMPRSTSLNRSQSVYTKPPPPRMDNYSRNLAQSQSLCPKPSAGFTALSHSDSIYKNNPRQDTLYVTSKSGIVKPEPVYGTATYTKQNDSGDSNYSTYRGSASYSSSRSSNPGPPIPMSRTRIDNLTPNSVASAHSGHATPSSTTLCYSPNPQY
ncbi:putative Neurogenic protein big brain-like [Homarus americanus]|uniref:Putative Neurogenic protein big brain-like n=2 Tax=Homarus americanus TaxID=6706 RepID=A0A8J5JVF9_HOMAM|nr:putative Neurogenic protein big brain-like [Homarus americanus]